MRGLSGDLPIAGKGDGAVNRQRKKGGTFSRLLGYVGRQPVPLIGVFACALVGNTAIQIAPRLVGKAIDLIVPSLENDFFPALLRTLAVIGALYLTGALLNWLTALCANLVANRTVKALRIDLFNKLGELPLQYHDTHSRGDVMSRFTNDIDAISDGLNQGIVQLVSGVITVLLCLGFMLSLNPTVTLVAVFVTPLCFLVGYLITRYGSRRFKEQSQALGKLNGYAEELISGQRTVKAFGYETRAQEKFEGINEELYRCGYRAQFASALVNPSTRFVNNIAYVLVGVFGILAVLKGDPHHRRRGQLSDLYGPILQALQRNYGHHHAAAAGHGLRTPGFRRAWTRKISSPNRPNAARYCSRRTGVYRVRERFAFRIPAGEAAHRRISTLRVKPGMMVAIVGPTGAGKTTLVNLLMRFYEVDAGSIAVEGQDITALTRDSLRRSFGMVLQETWLFSGTIRDNIAYGKPAATDQEVEAAARAAHAHSFIRRLPEGYQTVISEDGGNLSQGQKQLLTIARAMLLNPPMLILDEATSSVDILTELRIQKVFRQMMEGKTSFIIAHRLSTIRDADLILVLNKGNVVEMGTHDELLEKGGFYSNLYNSQFAPVE